MSSRRTDLNRAGVGLCAVLLALASVARSQGSERSPEQRLEELKARLEREPGRADAILAELVSLGPAAGDVLRRAFVTLDGRRAALALGGLADLAHEGGEPVRGLALRALADGRPGVAAAAARALRDHADEEVGRGLLELARSSDREGSTAALEVLAAGVHPGTWGGLWRLFTTALDAEPVDERVAVPCQWGLGHLLALEADRATDRVVALIEACVDAEGPERRLRLLAVATRSGAPAARPFLRRLLELRVASQPDGLERAPVDEVATEPRLLSALERLEEVTWSDGELVLVLEGLPLVRDPLAFPVALDACRHPSMPVRRAALTAAARLASPEHRLRAAAALVDGLTVADRGVRELAGRELALLAGQRLPAAYGPWSRWLALERAREARAARAREAGYERLEDYLDDHPEEALDGDPPRDEEGP